MSFFLWEFLLTKKHKDCWKNSSFILSSTHTKISHFSGLRSVTKKGAYYSSFSLEFLQVREEKKKWIVRKEREGADKQRNLREQVSKLMGYLPSIDYTPTTILSVQKNSSKRDTGNLRC